jgi:zinc/manganese transport system substrate-binding protein
VARCIATIPPARRKLVTTHDALGAYARRYGLEVIATVIPSRSTRGQASAGETAELVRTIRREKVPAVFPESSVRADVERAIAEEAGARPAPPLWADSLGPAGSAGATYAGSIAANTHTIASALGGDLGRCP